MKLSRKTYRRHGAFTSVEIMVAIVISMILSTIAIVGFRIYQRELPTQYAAQSLAHAMASARALAVSNNSVYTLQIDQTRQNFWIDETSELGMVLVPKVISPEALDEKVLINSIQFSDGEALAAGIIAPIRFFADGHSDDVRINFTRTGGSANNKVFTLRLYGPTGISQVTEL